MRKVLLELGGVRVEGVVERDYVLLPVAAVLAAGGSIRALPLEAAADPEPDPPAARVPPPPPAPRRARLAAAKPPARPQAKPGPTHKRKRGGKRWNRPAKKHRRD